MSVINNDWSWNPSNGRCTEQKGNDRDVASTASTGSSYCISLPDRKWFN